MRNYRMSLQLSAALLLAVAALQAKAQSPALFYSDIVSGPATGGERGNGAFITLYGRRFGPSQGSSYVTVGGVRAQSYTLWSDTKIVFQPGAAAQTGNMVVTTATGSSVGLPFTVRAGNIYFVSTKGSDGNSGSFASPWRSVLKARDTMQPGDITYAMDGVKQTEDDGQGWDSAILLRGGGSEGLPVALVAYPGATVQIGSPTGPGNAIRTAGKGTAYWVFAGLTIRGAGAFTAWYADGWRIISNDISCPNGDGATGCFESSLASNVKFLGNTVHDAGKDRASALYHGVYFSSDCNYIEIGWNTIANVHGGRGIQFHSTQIGSGGADDPTGYNQHHISIHDNVIHDTACDGIILATVDPSKGAVELYNNIIYNAGKGPANPENTGNWACIYAPGYTNKGAAGGGVIDVANNTLYNCGSFSTPPWEGSNAAVMNGAHNSELHIRLRNNIIVNGRGVPYLSNPQLIRGTNNLFYGNGAGPTTDHILTTLSADPLLANPSQGEFHLLETSPARSAGVQVQKITSDLDGITRETGNDLGAYQYQLLAAPANPTPRSRK